MLEIVVPKIEREYWDEGKQEFISECFKGCTLHLEHSLVSLSKWESKWCKPFLDNKTNKSEEEVMDYIKCMTLDKNPDPSAYKYLTKENIDQIGNYINAPMSATYFSDDPKGKGSREPTTSELIYYWMVAQNIPFECQKWHLNRLLNLIRICNIKNAPPKKRSKREIMSRNAALNAQRKARLGTKG